VRAGIGASFESRYLPRCAGRLPDNPRSSRI